MQPLTMRAGLSKHWIFAPPRSRCKVPTSSGSTAVMAAAGSVARQPWRGIGASVGQMRFSSRRVQVELSFGAARRGVSYDDHPMISRFGSIVEKHVETSLSTFPTPPSARARLP